MYALYYIETASQILAYGDSKKDLKRYAEFHRRLPKSYYKIIQLDGVYVDESLHMIDFYGAKLPSIDADMIDKDFGALMNDGLHKCLDFLMEFGCIMEKIDEYKTDVEYIGEVMLALYDIEKKVEEKKYRKLLMSFISSHTLYCCGITTYLMMKTEYMEYINHKASYLMN